MPDQQLPEIEEGDEQRRDALLKQLLKAKPESREELKKKVKAWRDQERASSATGKKREPSA
jgi:GrpB-like predicted nucleotidyltransferase (UPF0157 family)